MAERPTQSAVERPDGKGNQALKAGVSAFVGTTVEWFDFFIYGTASALVLGDLFFPEASDAVGTLAAFGTFWVGFLARPLGGLVFGHFGDKFGRKSALVLTLLMMGIATLGVGLLPTYAQIGVAAPILLVALRMIQGVAMGGEWGGAVLIATEHAPKNKKVLYGAFAQQGAPVGNLLATLAFLAVAGLPDQALQSWGWRLPFLASALLVLIGLFIRLHLDESPEMRKVLESKSTVRVPMLEILRNHRKIVALGVGATIIGVTLSYVKTTFALSWATTDLSFTRSEFLVIIAVALIVQIIVQPFGAVLAERINIRKAVVWMIVPEIVLLPLMFVFISTGSMTLSLLGMALATIPTSMYYAALAGILAQVFPVEIRYSGLSMAYQLATTLFAGTAPMVGQFLLNRTGSIWAVVAMGMVYMVISLASVIALVRHDAWTGRDSSGRATPPGGSDDRAPEHPAPSAPSEHADLPGRATMAAGTR